jgi:GT2 family glycosyltransferase
MIVDVIILTDSTDVALTQRTIDTLIDSDLYEFRVQLVDSGNSNPLRYKNYHNYIHPESSFNYNKFLNIALTYCTGEWVVISNDDVSYEQGWFAQIMYVHGIRPDIEAFSPKDPLLYMRYFPNHFVGGSDDYFESWAVTEALQGWCTVIKRTALDKILPFDELFDMYYQDNDYAERLKEAGIKHALVRDSIVCHMETLNVGGMSEEKLKKFRIDEIKFRNKWKLYK